MRLFRTLTGWGCASDFDLTFDRIHQADFPNSKRRTGWLVRVRRVGRRKRVQHLAKTLAEATTWARQYWTPIFLREVRNGLPAELTYLYRQAVDEGNLDTFLATLD